MIHVVLPKTATKWQSDSCTCLPEVCVCVGGGGGGGGGGRGFTDQTMTFSNTWYR